MRAFWFAVLLAVVPLAEAHGWGQEGHSIVAEIAQRRLDAGTRDKVKALLNTELPGLKDAQISFASIASWADDYRADKHDETRNWHFVNIPNDRDTYVAAVDCAPDPQYGDCIINAIDRVKATLADCTKPAADRVIALKFLVHFIGDLHQPLHATSRIDPETGKNDEGGNGVLVTFFNEKTNLHKVWDTGLIMHEVYDWGEYVRLLETQWLPGKDIAALQAGDTIAWALAAHKAAHDVAYNYRPDHVLDDEYYRDSIPVVDRQLALAGVRLARVLNETLRSAQCK
jgi:S1/P1 Nuclease